MGFSVSSLLPILDEKSLGRSDDADMFSSPRAALALEIQGVRKQLQEKRLFLSKRKSLVLSRNRRSKSTPHVMKRSAATGERQRRPLSRVERRVRTLQRLVPSAKSMDLDGLFQETADYILNLEMQVKVMQILVKSINGLSLS